MFINKNSLNYCLITFKMYLSYTQVLVKQNNIEENFKKVSFKIMKSNNLCFTLILITLKSKYKTRDHIYFDYPSPGNVIFISFKSRFNQKKKNQKMQNQN